MEVQHAALPCVSWSHAINSHLKTEVYSPPFMCTQVHTHTSLPVDRCLYAHAQVCTPPTCVHTPVCIHRCTHPSIGTPSPLCAHAYIHVCRHACMYTQVHPCVHSHTCGSLPLTHFPSMTQPIQAPSPTARKQVQLQQLGHYVPRQELAISYTLAFSSRSPKVNQASLCNPACSEVTSQFHHNPMDYQKVRRLISLWDGAQGPSIILSLQEMWL